MKDLVQNFFSIDILKRIYVYSFLYSFLNVSCKVLVLKSRQRPEAKVHKIQHKQLKKSFFWIFTCMMESIFLKLFRSWKFISQNLQLFLVNLNMFRLRVNPLTSLSNKGTSIGQHLIKEINIFRVYQTLRIFFVKLMVSKEKKIWYLPIVCDNKLKLMEVELDDF